VHKAENTGSPLEEPEKLSTEKWSETDGDEVVEVVGTLLLGLAMFTESSRGSIDASSHDSDVSEVFVFL